jgi:hypothetical protein
MANRGQEAMRATAAQLAEAGCNTRSEARP